jgi:hypothetical protein
MEPEILVTISFRLPQVERRTLATQLEMIMKQAIIVGGDTVGINLQPYTPEEDED